MVVYDEYGMISAITDRLTGDRLAQEYVQEIASRVILTALLSDWFSACREYISAVSCPPHYSTYC